MKWESSDSGIEIIVDSEGVWVEIELQGHRLLRISGENWCQTAKDVSAIMSAQEKVK